MLDITLKYWGYQDREDSVKWGADNPLEIELRHAVLIKQQKVCDICYYYQTKQNNMLVEPP